MREYDPTTGRYMQADPLGLVDGASVYGYALQNPGRYTDPRGEDAAAVTPGLLAMAAALCAADGPAPIGDIIAGAIIAGTYLFVASPTEACGCGNDGCPSAAEARKIASAIGNGLVKANKLTGMGSGARSGQHGTPSKRAGAEMTRLAKAQKCPSLKAAYLWKAKRLINSGKGISH